MLQYSLRSTIIAKKNVSLHGYGIVIDFITVFQDSYQYVSVKKMVSLYGATCIFGRIVFGIHVVHLLGNSFNHTVF